MPMLPVKRGAGPQVFAASEKSMAVDSRGHICYNDATRRYQSAERVVQKIAVRLETQ
jgi:hypothetical protein